MEKMREQLVDEIVYLMDAVEIIEWQNTAKRIIKLVREARQSVVKELKARATTENVARRQAEMKRRKQIANQRGRFNDSIVNRINQPARPMDDVSKQILELLGSASVSQNDLSRRLNLTASKMEPCLRWLERLGYIWRKDGIVNRMQ